MAMNAPQPMTYAEAARLLATFYRHLPPKPDAATSGGASAPNPYPGPADLLRQALAEGLGDFSDASLATLETTYPDAAKPISDAIWTKQRPAPPIDQPPPLISFDVVMRALGTLAFAWPGGVEISAGLGFVGDLKKSIQARDDWWAKHTEPQRSSKDLAGQIISALSIKIDSDKLQTEIEGLLTPTIAVENQLAAILPDPTDAMSAANGALLTTLPGATTTRGALLASAGLGVVFELSDNDILQKDIWLPSGGTSQEQACDLGLAANPTFEDAQTSLMARSSVALVNGMLAYVILAVLPDDAFSDPNWINSQAGLSFSLEQAILDHGLAQRDEEVASVQTTLSNLYDRLGQLASSLTAQSNAVFSKLDARLSAITFEQPDNPDGSVFRLPVDTSITVDFRLDGIADGLSWRPETWLCNQYARVPYFRLTDPNVVGTDDSLLAQYRSFQTTLTVSWQMPDNITTQGEPGPLGSVVEVTSDFDTLNSILKSNLNALGPWHFPLDPSGQTATNSQPVAWWTAPVEGAPMASLFDPTKAGFLGTIQGRSVIAWLGYVLQVYAARYRYDIKPPAAAAGVADAWTTGRLVGDIVQALDGWKAWVLARNQALEKLEPPK